MHDVVLWLGDRFSPEAYLFWTRIQCLLWTGADLVIVYCLTRIANLGRARLGHAPHRAPYVVLAVTALMAPGVAFAATGMQVFLLELAITVPHFLVIIYLMAANLRTAPRAFAQLLEQLRARAKSGA
jgi:hypothetical protein